MNLKATIAAILTGLLISGSALASVCTGPALTLATWAGAAFNDSAPCDNDTTWTLTAFTPAIGATGVTLTEDVLGGINVYSLIFDFSKLTAGHFGPGQVASVDYTVLILNPAEFWTSFSMDTTCPAQSVHCTVTKNVNGTVLVSADGANVGPAGLAGLLLTVHEDFVTDATGLLSSATNTYTLKNLVVPEPMSLALVGIGLVAFGFARRRKS